MRINWLALKYLVCAFLVCSSSWSSAEPFGIQLKELDSLLNNSPDSLVFIDVRDPIEIMFTGFTDAVDSNIPYQFVDRSLWNEQKGVFMMNLNTNFVEQVKSLLIDKGLSKDARIVTMCRSGSARGKPSAEYLRAQGFSGARYLINGFQGSVTNEGEHKGLRVENGWQNSGLPWQQKPNPLKIYRD